MAVGDYVPLFVSVGFLLFVGLIFPFGLSFFVDVDTVDLSTSDSSLVGVILDGFTVDLPFVDSFTFNIFDYMPFGVGDAIQDSALYVSLLPLFLQTFIIVLCIIALLYSTIKLVPFFY